MEQGHSYGAGALWAQDEKNPKGRKNSKGAGEAGKTREN